MMARSIKSKKSTKTGDVRCLPFIEEAKEASCVLLMAGAGQSHKSQHLSCFYSWDTLYSASMF